MNSSLPADFSDEPDDSDYIALTPIEVKEKRLGRKLTKNELRRILEEVTKPKVISEDSDELTIRRRNRLSFGS